METKIFTLNSRRKRGILSFFIPLLALFVGLGGGQVVKAQTQYDNAITLTQQPTNSTSTSVQYAGKHFDPPYSTETLLGSIDASPVVPSPFLGTYDLINTSNLALTGGVIATSGPGRGVTITSAVLLYRVYLANTPAGQIPSYTQLALPANGNDSFGDLLFQTTTANINLLAGLNSGGAYTAEVRFVINTSNGPVIDPGSSYTATFNVTPPASTFPGATTTWIGGATNDVNNWLNVANWSNGVPNARADVIIPSPPRPYPPILNDNQANYAARNLTIQIQDPANAFTSRGILRVTTATLKVFGNISNGGNGILATTDAPGTVSDPNAKSAVIVLAGANQTVDQGRFANLIIQNNVVDPATGAISASTTPVIKSNLGVIETPGSIVFSPNINAIVRSTAVDNSGNLVLDTGGNEYVDLKSSGNIGGETNTAFVLGLVKTDRPITPGVQNTFGGMGIDITINSPSATPGQALITRATGAVFSPVTSTTSGSSPSSIKRVFGNSFTGLQSGFNADVVFHYNNSTTTTNGADNELGTNRDGFLHIFRTVSGSTFQNLGGINNVDPTTYPGNGGTVTVRGLSSVNTLTLADETTNPLPLPVELVAFDVQRTGANALVTWITATEKNSKGFFVEVSADGKTFRSLGFVASPNAFSSKPQSYTFTDSESGKSGKRYYRLHQVDFDGKISFSPVRMVDFTGAVGATSAVSFAVYPNPLNTGDALHLNLVNDASTSAQVTVLDLTGRILSQQDVMLGEGSAINTDNLKAGVYFVRIATPSGLVKTVKVQKQ